MIITLICIVWFLSGFLPIFLWVWYDSGITIEDLWYCCVFGLFGPILVTVIGCSQFAENIWPRFCDKQLLKRLRKD